VTQNGKRNQEASSRYLTRFEELSHSKEKYDSRIRFLILDTLELASNQWQGRTKKEGPRRIQDIHKDAAIEEQSAKARNNPKGGDYGRRGQGGRGHGGLPRQPARNIRVNPRPMNASTLPSGSPAGGRPGSMRRNAHPGGNTGSNKGRERHGGHGGHGGSAVCSRPASGAAAPVAVRS
jgi:hypothetical protein